MIINDLEYRLARGLSIPYMGTKIKQPRFCDIDNEGLLKYSSYQSLFILRKEHLTMDEKLNNITTACSFFETLFIMDNYMEEQGTNDGVLYVDMLMLSLAFFLDINIATNKIIKNNIDKYICIFDEHEQPIFVLNNDNFEEFSKLIRQICCCSILEEKKSPPKNPYKNETLRRKFEKIQKQNTETEEKRRKENEITIADMIGLVSINEKSKYKFEDINNLTIWQLNYIYNGMLVREDNEFMKMQFCSYKFTFDKDPSFNWKKDMKVKLINEK